MHVHMVGGLRVFLLVYLAPCALMHVHKYASVQPNLDIATAFAIATVLYVSGMHPNVNMQLLDLPVQLPVEDNKLYALFMCLLGNMFEFISPLPSPPERWNTSQKYNNAGRLGLP